MKWFDRIAGFFAPAQTVDAFARKRFFLKPKRVIRVDNRYDAAGDGRRSTSWNAPGSGPTEAILPRLSTLRNRARDAVRNNPHAQSAISSLVSNTIGTGITPRPRHPDADIRARLIELWDEWTAEADADGRTDFYGLQALVARAMFESGECFVRLCHRPMADDLSVPLQLQALEADFVPVSKNEIGKDGNIVRAGIEFDRRGQRVAYWIYRQHPGDNIPGASVDALRVPADEILHIFEPQRPGQIRGVPLLATVLAKMKTLDDFDDAVLFRQEVANLFAGFIRKPVPEDAQIDPTTGLQATFDRDGSTPMTGIEPGSMQELLPGEEVEFSDPPDAGNAYPDFMRQQSMAIAAGMGLPFELLTGDLRGVNDRVIRVVLNEFHRKIEQRQWGVFIHQLCRPARAAWLDAAVLAGAIALPDYQNQRRAYLKTRWSPQGWAYIHPVQDVQATLLRIRSGLTSRSEAVLREGYDAEQIDAENAADNERANRFGLVYDSDVRIQETGDGDQETEDR
ncbi:MAG: phage portal protein [Zoogloeaceae bacterium]|jgi:lambda family phage portal protein|nr:phage portal protein [Zoogloeaceae bacterium]